MKTMLVLAAVVSLAVPVLGQTSKTLLNLNGSGVALHGYDAVAFFTENKPVKGTEQFSSEHDGATYLFSSQADKETFDQSPAKYEPSFGGYCAYGVSHDKLVDIDVDAFQIVDGRLLMQYSKRVRREFNEDQNGNLAKADANWPDLVAKNGK